MTDNVNVPIWSRTICAKFMFNNESFEF